MLLQAARASPHFAAYLERVVEEGVQRIGPEEVVDEQRVLAVLRDEVEEAAEGSSAAWS